MNASRQYVAARIVLVFAVCWACFTFAIGWHLTAAIATLWIGTAAWWVVESRRLVQMTKRYDTTT